MSTYRTKKIDRNTKIIKDFGVSEFLIEGNDKILLVDTGYNFSNIKEYVKSITNHKKELIVLNTHFHPDHSSGNYLFKEVYIGEKDIPFNQSLPYDNLVKRVTKAIYKEHPIKSIPLRLIVNKVLKIKKGKTKYIPLHDNDKINLGGKELIINELPGHTNGSIILLDHKKKTVYTGDAVNMFTWLFTNPEMKISKYTKTLNATYKELKSKGYSTLRCSHIPLANNLQFIKDYANFLDNIKIGDETFKFNLPGIESPLCIKIKPNLKHLIFGVVYLESQVK